MNNLLETLKRPAPALDVDLATFKRIDARFRYKFYRAGVETGCARWDAGAGLWIITGDTMAGQLTGPQLREGIGEWIREGGTVMLWACLLPDCNSAEMKAVCATVPNVTHGYCERCGPKYLQDLQAEILMLNSCRSPLELRRN